MGLRKEGSGVSSIDSIRQMTTQAAYDTSLSTIAALEAENMIAPEAWLSMLRETENMKPIAGLSPWRFLPSEGALGALCASAAKRPVLVFAQAIGEDMIACFASRTGQEPWVLVVNPWNSGGRVITELADYAAWLLFAETVAREVAELEADLD